MRRWLSSLGKGKRKGLGNSGSALITVIVVVMFITILATTLLYVSGMNYQIKQTDYKNKKSFYSGETTLENIRAQFMKDASDAAVVAYQITSEEYVSLGSGNARRAKYNEEFVKELEKRWQDQIGVGGSWETWLNTFVAPNAPAAPDAPGAVIELDSAVPILDDSNKADGYVLVQGIKLTFMDDAGYTTVITTDFWVCAPDFNWDQHNGEDGVTPIEQEPIDITDYVQYVKWTKQ